MGDMRDRIESVDDIKREVVRVKEWDMDIEVRAISGADVALVYGHADRPDDVFRANLIIATCYDPADGTKVFSDTNADRDLINGKNAFATGSLVNAAMRLNGLSEEGRGELKNG